MILLMWTVRRRRLRFIQALHLIIMVYLLTGGRTASLRIIKSVDDQDFMGVYTSENSSAKLLRCSTLSDELKVATQGRAEVYSIAPTREMAVLAAGHAADGAFWLNDETGKWAGTTYYGDCPLWVSNYNDKEGLDFRINNLEWLPYLPVTSYQYITTETKQILALSIISLMSVWINIRSLKQAHI